MLHMHAICCDCTEFRDEILLRGGEFKTLKNSNFLKNGKMVILIKIQNFSRSWMTKQTSPFALSHEIYLPRRISSNFETIKISRLSRHGVSGVI